MSRLYYYRTETVCIITGTVVAQVTKEIRNTLAHTRVYRQLTRRLTLATILDDFRRVFALFVHHAVKQIYQTTRSPYNFKCYAHTEYAAVQTDCGLPANRSLATRCVRIEAGFQSRTVRSLDVLRVLTPSPLIRSVLSCN